jgi:pimeloyl-ACP methyl ester carboxylesterase
MKSSVDAGETGGRRVDVGGLTLYINDIGRGYPVICLHGGGPGASGWSNFKQNVPAISAKYRMILMDMPNFGRSQMCATPEGRLSHCAIAIRKLMDTLEIERAHFIGNSIGAQSAIKFAIDCPARIDRFVAMGNNAFQHGFFMPRPTEGIRIIADYYKGEGPTRDKMRKLIQTLVWDSSFLTDAIVEERFRASATPEAIAQWTKDPPKAEDISHLLGKVQCPTLFVWGAEDRFSSIDSGLTMVKMFKDAEIHIFPRCGHWAQVERAVDFDALALAFFARGER